MFSEAQQPAAALSHLLLHWWVLQLCKHLSTCGRRLLLGLENAGTGQGKETLVPEKHFRLSKTLQQSHRITSCT